MRAHFNRALLDQEGNQIGSARVRVLLPGSTSPIGDTVYASATGGTTRTNPWTTTSGEVDFYLDVPARVRIGVTVGTNPERFWDDIDVTAIGVDSPHSGSGTQSLQIGATAAASGAAATALGQGAQAVGDGSTALGDQAQALLDGAVAAGSQAAAQAAGTVAVGPSSLARGEQATALGAAARASYNQSTALGAGAQSDRPHQVVLGTRADTVFMPGTAALQSPNGSTFQLAVTDDGHLYTLQLPLYEEPEPVDEGSGE